MNLLLCSVFYSSHKSGYEGGEFFKSERWEGRLPAQSGHHSEKVDLHRGFWKFDSLSRALRQQNGVLGGNTGPTLSMKASYALRAGVA